MELCGAKIVTVETRKELEAAINEKTGMMFFLNKGERDGQVKSADFVKIGKERGVPTLTDAASDATPKENLWKYTKLGFDLVIFSGGKALRGPQSSGLLLGRKDLIEAAMPAMSPCPRGRARAGGGASPGLRGHDAGQGPSLPDPCASPFHLGRGICERAFTVLDGAARTSSSPPSARTSPSAAVGEAGSGAELTTPAVTGCPAGIARPAVILATSRSGR